MLRTAPLFTRRRTGSRPARTLLALTSLLVALLVSAGPLLEGACATAAGAGRIVTRVAHQPAQGVHPAAHDHGAASHLHGTLAGGHSGEHERRDPGPDGDSCSAAMICGAVALTVVPSALLDALPPRAAPSGSGIALVSITRTPEPPPPRG